MALFTGTEQQYYEGSDGNQASNINDYGNYQFIYLDDIITNFIIAYVGEDKIISKIKRTDVAFHAQRAMQELAYDTARSEKSQEIEVAPNLMMPLPHDYVNYVKLSWVDDSGIERVIYPASKTSNHYYKIPITNIHSTMMVTYLQQMNLKLGKSLKPQAQ